MDGLKIFTPESQYSYFYGSADSNDTVPIPCLGKNSQGEPTAGKAELYMTKAICKLYVYSSSSFLTVLA